MQTPSGKGEWGQRELARTLRQAGGKWDRRGQLRIIQYDKVSEPGPDSERIFAVPLCLCVFVADFFG
ncbi:hypothetical protein [Desulfonema magnum]|uniref:Uncharacterized protein n=1 Tax=Desulfonema magnum TaxID=45655 RepID=A0A975GPC5_9BACT|nr:hypothetical protein [Desulfonema magnum]QTA88694.1 Uncharacterized protein dnm_047410 [Desulfonema magnum]